MKGTLYGFCRLLLEGIHLRRTLNPEWMAAAFVDYFGVSCRPHHLGQNGEPFPLDS